MSSPSIPAQVGAGQSVERPEANHKTGSERLSQWLNRGSALLVLYFALRLLYFALTISPFAPPDEVTHAGICQVFSRVLLLPVNSPETFQYGLVTNIPWLYYWIMGKLVHLNVVGLNDLVFLRLLNIPLALGTVFFTLRTLRLVTRDQAAQFLLVAVMTNTMMFSFLSASVSYDNLMNLLAAMAVYYLLAFFRERSGDHLAAALICMLAGTLTKVTFLLLALVLVSLLVAHELRNIPGLPGALLDYFRNAGRRSVALVLAILVLTGLNLALYGGNQLRYGDIYPPISKVLPRQDAMQYRLEARAYIFKEYKENRISYMEALQLTGGINHPGDKADTFYLLMTNENLKLNPGLKMGPAAYLRFWFENMMSTAYGIKGHLLLFKPLPHFIPFVLLLGLALAGMLARWRPASSGWLPPCLAAIVVAFSAYHLVKVNYDAYVYYGVPGMTLTARYLFPVLGSFYILFCHYLMSLFRPEPAKIGLALATALFFMVHDFPWFLAQAGPEWYQW